MIILFFIGTLLLAIVTSYTDIKNGIIRNKHLMLAILYGIIINAIMFLVYTEHNASGYIDYGINLIFSLALGFFFWKIGIWTAGDGKLYAVLNLLSPPEVIQRGYLGSMYGITFLTNALIVFIPIFLFKIISRVSKDEFKEAIKHTFRPRLLISLPVFLFGMHILDFLKPAFFPSNIITNAFFMFLLLGIAEYISGKRLIPLMLILSAIRLVVDWQSLLDGEYWINFAIILISMILFRFLFLNISYYAFTKEVNVDELHEKMFLAEDIVPVNFEELNKRRDSKEKEELGDNEKRYSKIKYINLSLVQYFRDRPFSLPDYDKKKGLRKKNLIWIYHKRARFIFDTIRIFDTMPFAPVISLGFILTWIIRSDIMIFIVQLGQ